ncbi:MAG: phosphoribosylformylglycinamidine cyclo-ligase [Myxococcota bacterium]
MPITYADAGVDIEAGASLVERIKPLARSTLTPWVVDGIGGFAGLSRIPGDHAEPLLVAGTDGVGTKLRVAQAMARHDTIGVDLVAMCVNDILTVGAKPLFFLDYFATGKLSVEVGEEVVRGIAEGCRRAGCALLGGETAEMPGMYQGGDYDLAGFAVGVVDRAAILGPGRVKAGDALIAVASSGLHSNGYSLARRVVEHAGLSMGDRLPGTELEVGPALLEPTRIYSQAVARLQVELGADLHALCHITGGGLVENLPRVLPAELGVSLALSSYARPPLFEALARLGPIDEAEMRRTFNLGVGLVAVVETERVQAALGALAAVGETAWRIGEVRSGGAERVVCHD